jgi:hypothetical protein
MVGGHPLASGPPTGPITHPEQGNGLEAETAR